MIEIVRGDGPIVLGLPHGGTDLPDGIAAALNETGRALADTDWHIDRLYAGLCDGATTVRMSVHRYVIDVNRAPDGTSLYTGQNTTGLCPLTDFDGRPIWQDGMAPDPAEIGRRTRLYHAAYHDALSTELRRVHDIHGVAILYDCHSIRSNIPYLFPGILPDFNIGSNLTTTCSKILERTVEETCRAAADYSTVVNGRFKGGWTTRHYGRPETGFHAIQMELAQSTYMQQAPPWSFDTAAAGRLRTYLGNILNALETLVHTGALS